MRAHDVVLSIFLNYFLLQLTAQHRILMQLSKTLSLIDLASILSYPDTFNRIHWLMISCQLQATLTFVY